MKRFMTAFTLMALLAFSTPLASAESEAECGNWYDVPDQYMDVLMTVCEYGIMQGMNEDYFGFNHKLSRAEMAVIGNRLVFGSDTYDAIGESYSGFSTRLFQELLVPYSDAPADLYQNEWILKAMFYSSDIDTQIYEYPNGIMTGDSASGQTTFRPLEEVNIVEAYKVLYEAALQADVLEEPYEFVYSGANWYEDLLTHLDEHHAISSLNLSTQSIYLGGDVEKSYGPFSTSVNREHVAQFFYMMLEGGLIDEEALQEHVQLSNLEDDPDFRITDVYEEDGELYVEITNEGTADENGFDGTLSLRVYDAEDDLLVSMGEHFEVEGGRNQSVTVGPFEMDEDAYRVDLEVTDDWDNNTDTETYYLSDDFTGSPDLVVQNLTLSPENPDSEDAISFFGSVMNIGDAGAPASVLYYYVGGSSTPYEVAIPALGDYGSGYTFEVEIDAGELEEGTYTNTVVVDAEEDVEEDREGNNESTLSYYVGEAM